MPDNLESIPDYVLKIINVKLFVAVHSLSNLPGSSVHGATLSLLACFVEENVLELAKAGETAVFFQ